MAKSWEPCRNCPRIDRLVLPSAFAPITTTENLAAFGAPADTPDTAQLKTLVNDGGGMDIPAFRSWLEQHLPR